MRNKQKFSVMLSAMLVLLVGLSIAYAALSTTLNVTVNSVGSQGGMSWNVGFTGSSATPTLLGTSATGRSCGTATITTTAVTIADTTLSKPGDGCRYSLTIKNSGTISAALTSITPTEPNGITCETKSGGLMVCGNITYKLATNTQGTVLTSGSTLAPNATLPVYLIMEYTGTSLAGETIVHSGAKFSILYSQA